MYCGKYECVVHAACSDGQLPNQPTRLQLPSCTRASLSIFRARLKFKKADLKSAENTAFSGQDYIMWHLKESTSHLIPICHSRSLCEQKLLPPLILGGKSNFASCHAKIPFATEMFLLFLWLQKSIGVIHFNDFLFFVVLLKTHRLS